MAGGYDEKAAFDRLSVHIAGIEKSIGRDVQVLFYISTPPSVFAPILLNLGASGLAGKHLGHTYHAKVIIEKPFGKDLESARALNGTIRSVFEEYQVYRIDHYLGKETVQDLLVQRFSNAIFEPLWNRNFIDHVQITVAEEVGVGTRGGYYEQSGCLRDMIQNHTMQLLALTAMEPPGSLDAESIRNEKVKLLRAIQPLALGPGGDVARAQYAAGLMAGKPVKGYLEEEGIQAQSGTETYAALRLSINNWRWQGVPFYLRTGKRMPTRVSEIVVAFKPIPHSIFPDDAGAIQSNKLVIRLQPDEGVRQWVMIKDPGPGGMRLRHVPLDMSFAEAFGVRNPDAYERLLMDIIRGNPTLFMRGDEVEAAWRWVDPILRAWERDGRSPHAYTAGTWGPSRAIALIERDGRTWHEETV